VSQARLRGRLLLPHEVAVGELVIEGGRVIDVVPDPAGVAADDPRLPWLAPGFIDVHVHGGGGGDTMDGAAGVRAMATAHLRHGTTAMLASTLTAPWPEVVAALRGVAEVVAEGPVAGRADLLGAHLEGPFLSARRLGAQPPFALAPTPERVDEALALGVIRSVTLAPELPGAMDAVARFARAGVVVGVGHTIADADTVAAAFEAARAADAGCAVVGTHLYNAMGGLGGREPGVVGAVLGDRAAYAELIVDGHHVAPAAVRTAFAAKPGRLVLVTDAIRAAGSGDGATTLGGRPVQVTGGAARLADGTLAGSVLTMEVAVRTAVAMGVPTVEALRAATSNPAELLGLTDRGRLAVGAVADLVVLRPDLGLDAVWQRGVRVA
jgi:N-acetylglucosamine-6-phosphate deacetylase